MTNCGGWRAYPLEWLLTGRIGAAQQPLAVVSSERGGVRRQWGSQASWSLVSAIRSGGSF